MPHDRSGKSLRVLILEDVPADAELVEQVLRSAGIGVVSARVDTRNAFVEALYDFSPDIILADYSLPGFDGDSALALTLEKTPGLPFIFVTGALGEERAVDLLKSGATDFVLKDRLTRLPLCVKRALEEVEEKRLRRKTEQELRRAHDELEAEVRERKAHQERLRALTSELMMTEERERRRIATELHDRIGQNLAISKIKLAMARQAAPSDELARSLGEIHEFIEQTIDDTRSLCFELSPPALYQLGLEPALEDLIDSLGAQHGIVIDFRSDNRSEDLSENHRVALYMAARELLLNIVKHAHANKASLYVHRIGNNLLIEVEDDGIGFDSSEDLSNESEHKGFGLFSLRERLTSLSGKLEIESEPGKGTRAKIIFPLNLMNPPGEE